MDDIDNFLNEDLGDEGDITSDAIFTSEMAQAQIIAKDGCVVAGLEEAKIVFEKVGAKMDLKVNDGEFVEEKTIIAEIKGQIKSILNGERLALNFIGRMSGIATETKKLVDLCHKINPDVRIAATRKTTPGFRKYEKRAVLLGGGEPHRSGLFDAVMIKDNHIKFAGSVEDAIKRVQDKIKGKVIEVEVENEEDAITAAKMNVNVIMLDNLNPVISQKIAGKIRDIDRTIIIEISGNVTLKNIEKYALFADRISLGYLTHSVKNMDFSLGIARKI
ncbi:MAG: carboxylating nicotinate-nucleotide diphosphorylase [Candidatus Thermoplasmatota archaeon]|nr:carboxylating nicotinate-nucleotide diphosphorylase [Candidatus Thermoplasmatota archaeon]